MLDGCADSLQKARHLHEYCRIALENNSLARKSASHITLKLKVSGLCQACLSNLQSKKTSRICLLNSAEAKTKPRNGQGDLRKSENRAG